MHRVGSTDGLYHDKDIVNKVSGTQLLAAQKNAIQEELCNLVESFGYTLDYANNNQIAGILQTSHLKPRKTLDTYSGIQIFNYEGVPFIYDGLYYRNLAPIMIMTSGGSIAAGAYAEKTIAVDLAAKGISADWLDYIHWEGYHYRLILDIDQYGLPEKVLPVSVLASSDSDLDDEEIKIMSHNWGTSNIGAWHLLALYGYGRTCIPPWQGMTFALLSTSPVTGDTNASVASSPSFNFNQMIDATTVTADSFYMLDSSNNRVDATITVSGRTISLTPAEPLTKNATYSVVAAATIASVYGDTLGSQAAITFTTTSFKVLSTYPADGDTDVSRTATYVYFTFSAALDQTTVTSFSFYMMDSTNTLVTAHIALNGSTTAVLELDEAWPLKASEIYRVYATTDIKDTDGDALSSQVLISFTTSAD